MEKLDVKLKANARMASKTKLFLSEQVVVADLISNGVWRSDLLGVLFCQRDRDIISKIPLSLEGGEDIWIWHYTLHGRFTVSSAYRLGITCAMQGMPSSSSSETDWKLLWDCKIPPKVKVFAWQLCNKAIATGVNLAKRGIRVAANCSRCRHGMQDDVHQFFTCEDARLAWKATGFSPFKMLQLSTSWLHLFHVMQNEMVGDEANLNKFIMCLWGLWNAHNDFVFGGRRVEPKASVENALSFLNSFLTCNAQKNTTSQQRSDHPSRWLPLGEGQIMLNVDASFGLRGSGYGYVLRDQCGRIIKSGAGPIHHATSATYTEIQAILEGFSTSSRTLESSYYYSI